MHPPAKLPAVLPLHHPSRTSPGGAARRGAFAAKLSRTPGSRGGHLRGHLRQPDGGTLTMCAAGRGGAGPPRPFSATRPAAAGRQPSCAVRAGKCSPRRKRIVAKLSRPRQATPRRLAGGACLGVGLDSLAARSPALRAGEPPSICLFRAPSWPPGSFRARRKRRAYGRSSARRLFFGAVGLAAVRRWAALWSLGSISPSPLPSPAPAGGWGRRQASQTAPKKQALTKPQQHAIMALPGGESRAGLGLRPCPAFLLPRYPRTKQSSRHGKSRSSHSRTFLMQNINKTSLFC